MMVSIDELPGSERPSTPLKITSIASPSIRGAITVRMTEITTIASTKQNAYFSGASSPRSRLTEGQKWLIFRGGSSAGLAGTSNSFNS